MAQDESMQKRAKNLIANFFADTKASSIDDSGANLLFWLTEKASGPGVGRATANCYRRWIAWHLENENHPAAMAVRSWAPPKSRESQLQKDEVDAQDLSARAQDKQKPEIDVGVNETNGRTISYIGEEGFRSLTRLLGESNAAGEEVIKEGWLIVLFLVTSAMTGLRPLEWKTARFLESHYDPKSMLTLGPVLEIQTLKQGGRREDNTLREKRFLVLDRWPQAQIDRLLLLLENIDVLKSQGENGFELWYNRSRKKLSRAWKTFATKNNIVISTPRDIGEPDERGVTFYTARHVFAEEVRRSYQYTRFEMAAMLGHCMLRNQRFYGPRAKEASREFDFVLPRPWPGDAEEIMEWDFKLNPIRHKTIQGSLFDQSRKTSGIENL